jgi:transposase
MRRDLFSSLDLVFFDTTSIYFEGKGGETLGQRGKTKDHRPDLKQMVVGLVVDSEGRPVCCELWPGNTTDVTTLIPIVDRLRSRFHIGQVCIVADRGMISKQTIGELEAETRNWKYILGARMRNQKEVRDQVLSRGGRYRVVREKGKSSKDPSPLKVKEVMVGSRRYIVCLNEDQATKDAADREAIVASLREQLKRGDKSLVGNKGYRKYLAAGGAGFEIDEHKMEIEARYDGKWVLRTNMSDLSADEVALQYKELWMVEQLFRCEKSLLKTRPIWHKRDDTIRGHVFCSFLALVLRHELFSRLRRAGHVLEWNDVIRDLESLQTTTITYDGKKFLLRSTAERTCGKVFQAAGVALPPTLRQI